MGTKVVCDDSEGEKEEPTEIAEDESTNNDDNTNTILTDIFEIFGIGNARENEIEDGTPVLVPETSTTTEFMVDDGLLPESTTKTVTTSTVAPTTTTTTTTTTSTSTSTSTTTLRTTTVTDLETVTTDERRMN